MSIEQLKESFLQGWIQASKEEAQDIFNELLKNSVRLGLLAAMEEEVNNLCGKKHHPDPDSPYKRAGSEKGVMYANGEKESVKRPRVRTTAGEEVKLEVYEAASDQNNLFEEVVSCLEAGVSVRSIERKTNKSVSKSAASRMWVEQSRSQLEAFRDRSLQEHDLISILIDGVVLAKETHVIIALGIDIEGNKHALDFEPGTSESAETVGRLMERLIKRGVSEPKGRRLLVQRDGSQAIASAVSKYFPEAIQQECLVHFQRNLKDRMRKKDHEELDLKFKRLREAEGAEAGEEAWADLGEFISERNTLAASAMEERKDKLLAFHRLNVPSTLNRTFLSTNIIENAIRNWRSHTGNIKLWKEKEDMISRWSATGLLWSENTFNRIPYAEDLSSLLDSLAITTPATEANASSASEVKANENLTEATE